MATLLVSLVVGFLITAYLSIDGLLSLPEEFWNLPPWMQIALVIVVVVTLMSEVTD